MFKRKTYTELKIVNVEHERKKNIPISTVLESNERLNLFIDNVSDYAIIFFDINGNITSWNSGAEHIKLYKNNEIIGKNFTETDQQNNKPEALLSKALSDGQVQDEGWRVKKDGTLYWESVTIICLRKKDGTHYGFVKIAHDLTERKLAEEEIRKLNSSLEQKVDRIEQRAAELVIANKELEFQTGEKGKRAAELIIANTELVFQNDEKEKRAAELVIANKELAYQSTEKEKRAAELIIANKELVFHNEEKEKRAAELIIANKELVLHNIEKEMRAAELIIANTELVFQNEEKEKRAAELVIANKELAFQNIEKEKRAGELIIANEELAFQNVEKEKRAAELIIANSELAFQNDEKEKRAEELLLVNNELEAFSYSVSHDLRAPLRHIGGFVDLLLKNNSSQLDVSGLRFLNTISGSSLKMGKLIDALLAFSRLNRGELQRTNIDTLSMVTRILKSLIDESEGRIIETRILDLPDTLGDENLINQVWINLISNAAKYSKNKEKSIIEIGGKIENKNAIFYIKDNGVGFEMQYADKLFGVFQRLHNERDFEGIGIGLANINRIIIRHGGKCWAVGEVDKGATFFFSLPIF
jgi:PAS domain S-box-containing protein